MVKHDTSVFELQKLLVQLSKVKRDLYVPGTNKQENNSEHSLGVALLCWYIHQKFDLGLDLTKILKYAIVHDMVEVYAGDVNAFSTEEERKEKKTNESNALSRLKNEFQSFGEMTSIISDYQNKADDEANFVWSVDKIQAVVMSQLDNWRFNEKLDISYQDFTKLYTKTHKRVPEYLQDYFWEIVEYCQSVYYEKPD